MADHSNIQDPDGFDRMWREVMDREVEAARRLVLERRILSSEGELSAIFNRVRRGELVELHYRDGTVISIVAASEEQQNG